MTISNRAAIDSFQQRMQDDGYVLVPDLIPQALLLRLRKALADSYDVCRSIQVHNGISEVTCGTSHHLIGQNDAYLEILQNQEIIARVRQFIGGNVILNTSGGVINQRGARAYVHNVHRDVRFFTGDLKLMVNILIMLDDFTLENGATYLLAGSHRSDHKPNDAVFFAEAMRATGPAGSVLFFDSQVWHATGNNTTDQPRRAITMTFTRPFFKPQLDYCRFLGYERCASLPADLQNVLGYNARIPANLDEWYQPPEQRFYKPGQD